METITITITIKIEMEMEMKMSVAILMFSSAVRQDCAAASKDAHL